MNSTESRDEAFHANCGKILRMALHVETMLDFFISNYFCSPQSYRTFLLNDSVLINLNFERKVQIFQEICRKEGIEKKRISKIVKAINFVKRIRNRVAHDEAHSSLEEGIKLETRKSVKYRKNQLRITNELVREVDKKRLFSIQEIAKIHVEPSAPSREVKTGTW